MSTYYLDTSALIKRYVTESGTDWVRSLTNEWAGHLLLTARVTIVEVYSALARRKREGTVPAEICDMVEQAFTEHCATEYEFVELDMRVIPLARDLLARHPLKAYDAVQLASAVLANNALVANGLPHLIFVSSDEQLNRAATGEGLKVDNPNAHQ